MVAAATSAKYVFDLQPGDVYWCTADCGWVTGALATLTRKPCVKLLQIQMWSYIKVQQSLVRLAFHFACACFQQWSLV